MKIKLASSYNGYPGCYDRYGDDRFKMFKKHGYNYTTYSQWNTDLWNYTLPEEVVDERLLNEKKLAEDAGIIISNSHGPWRVPWRDATEEDRAERMEKMKRSIHNTRVIGAKYWVVHPIMPCGIDEDNLPEAKTTWELNKRFMSELTEHAVKEDVIICFENMPMLSFSMGRPEDIAKFIEEMNCPHFQGCLDTGHAHIFNDITIGDAVRVMGDHIKVIHAHDNFYNRDLHLYPLVHGTTNWVELGQALKEVKFDGIFELEVNPPTTLNDELFEDHAYLINKIGKELIRMMDMEAE